MANTGESDEHPGMLIFQDVFRRTDKNDVGAVSWENFVSFFADGVMSESELKSLFNEIDTHNTNNIDCGELCSYFSKHLGPFKEIYAKVGELNTVVNDALVKTSQEYPKSPRMDKFVTRFLLREMMNQFISLQRPLEAALEALDEQAKQERPDIRPIELDTTQKKSPSGVIPGHVVRRAKRQISSQSNASDGSVSLSAQVDRLAALLDRLENRVNFDGITDEDINLEVDDVVVLVQRTLPVKSGSEEEYKRELKEYIQTSERGDGCLHVNVRSYKENGKMVIYEIWESNKQLKRFEDGPASKSLADLNATHLSSPLEIQTMTIPAQWWRKEN
ncbi:N-terminal EF-hand calcium-binding protein 1-like isoform X2 [Liolophura sinensis]|uniref:N-terminal EF-hand calcium-binding protein 1-like isoform X2 n=1 Tax=Liolophura sinensis TaxID=3198878 RepID=UPI003158408B